MFLHVVTCHVTDEIVVQIKGTVLLMPNGSDLVTKAPQQAVTSEKKVRG